MAFSRNGSLDESSIEDVPSANHNGLDSAIFAYLKDKNEIFDGISVGIAGPVIGDFAEVTNLGWAITKEGLIKSFAKYGVKKVGLLNDLEAFAWGVSSLNVDSLQVLKKGKISTGNKAVVAAGTGLGMAGILEVGENSYTPFATEGGHTSFAPSKEDSFILDKLSDKYNGHVSFERIVSGKFGFSNLFYCLKERFPNEREEFEKVKEDELGPYINKMALEGSALANEIISKFLYYYGVAASNFALMQKATGGVYIAGGIAPKLKSFFESTQAFQKGFLEKGRFSTFLDDIPVYLIENEFLALQGSSNYLDHN